MNVRGLSLGNVWVPKGFTLLVYIYGDIILKIINFEDVDMTNYYLRGHGNEFQDRPLMLVKLTRRFIECISINYSFDNIVLVPL